MHRGVVLIAVVVAAACGDNGGHGVDAGPPADAFATADATVCEPNAPEIFFVDVFPQDPLVLVLDGIGTPCEQALRALPQLVGPVPSVEHLLLAEHTATCEDFGGDVFIRLTPPAALGGVPLISPFWEVQVFVWTASGETFIGGQYLDVVALPPPGCLGEIGMRFALPGHEVGYTELTNCFPSGGGTYTIAVGDAYAMGDEALWIDPLAVFPSGPRIHRARLVDVLLLPAHVTEPIRFSDFMCCDGENLVDCVGPRLLVDTFTAEILQQERRCEPTCSP